MSISLPLRLHVAGRSASAPTRSASGTKKASGPAEKKTRNLRHLVFPVLAVGAVFQAIMQTVMVPLLPSMPGFTGAGPTAVSWLVTSTLLVGAVMTPIFGRLAT